MFAPTAPAQVQPTAAASPVTQFTFGNNRVKLLNVDPWGALGFGAPDPDDQCCFSQNQTLRNLAHQIGQAQLLIMMDPAARGWQPPNGSVASKVGAMYNRAKQVMLAEMIAEGDRKQTSVETSKADQSAEAFLLHPVPYFEGPMVCNEWLDKLNKQVMTLLINLFQHSYNRYSYGLSAQCVQDLLPFLNQIALTVGVELCGLSQAQVLDPQFLFDLSESPTGHFTVANYHPSQNVPSLEAMSTQGPTLNVPTIQDVAPMWRGIKAHILKNLLAQAPKGPVPSASGMQGNPMMTRDAVLAYASVQPNAVGTARDTLIDAINAEEAKTNAAPDTTNAAATASAAPGALPTVPQGAA